MNPPALRPPSPAAAPGDGLVPFFALACAFTWALAAPLTLAWMRHAPPPAWAVPLAGLSAFGPAAAAALVARRRGGAGQIVRPFVCAPKWVLLGLFAPMALHLVARALDVALGATPTRWLYLPETSEHVAALVVFSLGEEPGWRGFAHRRAAAAWGPVSGALGVGAVWGVWHLAYCVQPATGAFSATAFGLGIVELCLYAVVVAWLYERSGRAMAAAMAIHAGGHLDNINRAAALEPRFRVLHLLVVAAAAGLAARSLRRAVKPVDESVEAPSTD